MQPRDFYLFGSPVVPIDLNHDDILSGGTGTGTDRLSGQYGDDLLFGWKDGSRDNLSGGWLGTQRSVAPSRER